MTQPLYVYIRKLIRDNDYCELVLFVLECFLQIIAEFIDRLLLVLREVRLEHISKSLVALASDLVVADAPVRCSCELGVLEMGQL